ncbi:MAG: hypothetical protein KGQ41_09030, partial [Alphaproteobacteria bacterium]|nr:hypothetical protein [Alphaproteobacteria bacterium]
MKNRLRILLMLALLAWPQHARAADDDAQSTRPVTYVEANLRNISDVLFTKGILRTDDPAAVEEHIRIHECGLYEEYINNDFAWSRLREAYGRNLAI